MTNSSNNIGVRVLAEKIFTQRVPFPLVLSLKTNETSSSFCDLEAIGVLIVGCQVCGEIKVLAGSSDVDGVARVRWFCEKCGAGQVLQLVSTDVRRQRFAAHRRRIFSSGRGLL